METARSKKVLLNEKSRGHCWWDNNKYSCLGLIFYFLLLFYVDAITLTTMIITYQDQCLCKTSSFDSIINYVQGGAILWLSFAFVIGTHCSRLLWMERQRARAAACAHGKAGTLLCELFCWPSLSCSWNRSWGVSLNIHFGSPWSTLIPAFLYTWLWFVPSSMPHGDATVPLEDCYL